MQKKIRVLLLISGLVLFKIWVWDEYIVNSTADAALDGKEGKAGVSYGISNNKELAIRPYEEGFKVYAVSKGFWGWSITDEMFVGDHEIVEQELQFKGREKLYVSLIVDKKQSFDKIIGYSANIGTINFNRTVGENSILYYYYSDQPLGKVTYEGTRLNGKTEKLSRDKEPG
ncbi:hypothetical protein M3152_14835 [Sporosarcina luteola]|uniref:hypothetical protein n=1 Tax=Sporosarcina luteola TaxID=582850 RepID=UPI00203F54FE|nr:hypothetical protein [Sporosarcina luteola]MCM3638977.1 hypothetical protein [Sporosarcina luteola]